MAGAKVARNQPGANAPAAAARAPADGGPSGARQQQIRDWVAHRSDSSGGFLGFGETSAVEHVHDALTGRAKELGRLTRGEQRLLMDRVLARWSAGKGVGPGGATQLVQSFADDRPMAAMVAQRLAVKAAVLMQQPTGDGSINDPHRRARAYALDALQAIAGEPSRTSASSAPLREMLESLGPDGAVRFVQALNPSAPGNSYSAMSQAQDRILAAMNAGARTPTASAVARTIFAETSFAALRALPALQQHMAMALAREWYPENPVKQTSEMNRLAGILGTAQGQQLLFGSNGSPLGALAWGIVRDHPAIDAATLGKTEDPWANVAIVGPLAQTNAQRYLALRGDAPETLRGTDLDNTVGVAMHVQPTLPGDAAAQAKAAEGAYSYFSQQSVQAVVAQIHRLGGTDPQVTVLPIQFSSSATGPVQLPLFRVHTATGDQYVDNTGRSYRSFADWQKTEQLPPGLVTFPDEGHLTAGPHDSVKLDSADTPATPDTAWKQFKGFADVASLAGGMIVGMVIVGTGGLAIPVVIGLASAAIASGGWQAYGVVGKAADRSQHGQSLNPITDPEARDLWIALAADVAGMAAFASDAALVRIVGSGSKPGTALAWTLGTGKVAGFATNAGAFANGVVDLAANFHSLTPQQRVTALLSMGFWGVTSVVGARMFDFRTLDESLLNNPHEEAPRTSGLQATASMRHLVREGAIPGQDGVILPARDRVSSALLRRMFKLSQRNNIQYALVRQGGVLHLYSGSFRRVDLPIDAQIIAITHLPSGSGEPQKSPSSGEMIALEDTRAIHPEGQRPSLTIVWGRHRGDTSTYTVPAELKDLLRQAPRTPGLAATVSMRKLLKNDAVPGQEGVILPVRDRASFALFRKMYMLSERNKISYALVRRRTTLHLYSGSFLRVDVPIDSDPHVVIAITHPRTETGEPLRSPSQSDINMLNQLWLQHPLIGRPRAEIIWGSNPGNLSYFKAEIDDPLGLGR